VSRRPRPQPARAYSGKPVAALRDYRRRLAELPDGARLSARGTRPVDLVHLFVRAHAAQGTLCLDEVGLLPEPLQAKLLTAIEDGAIRRLGSTRSEPVEVWIIAASNQDLAIGSGRSRMNSPRTRETWTCGSRARSR
jgi:sigma54-dependent transcription regulator